MTTNNSIKVKPALPGTTLLEEFSNRATRVIAVRLIMFLAFATLLNLLNPAYSNRRQAVTTQLLSLQPTPALLRQ
jgi:hypothetical protein